jgi:hypothetical protein
MTKQTRESRYLNFSRHRWQTDILRRGVFLGGCNPAVRCPLASSPPANE